MCIHEYYIFAQCGHHFFVPTPLLPCAASIFNTSLQDSKARSKSRPKDKLTLRSTESLPRVSASASTSTPSLTRTVTPASSTTTVATLSRCSPRAHPYRTHMINTGLCLHCEIERSHALQSAAGNLSTVSVTEGKWRVKYENPAKARTATAICGGAGRDGGWAQGDELDVNGYVKREKEKEKEEERARARERERERRRDIGRVSEVSWMGVEGRGPALSSTSWKTAYSAAGNAGDRSWGSMISSRVR